ncbi:unnamed protein product [Calypogeia fissa]
MASRFFITIIGVQCWLLVMTFGNSLVQHVTSATAAPCPSHCQNGPYHQEDHAGIIATTNKSARALPHESSDHSYGRPFRAHGCAAHLFVEFGAYRGGNRTFTILGLASKPLHTYGHPTFSCEWIPISVSENTKIYTLEGTVTKDYPDYGYGRAYTVVVITCTFDVDVGTDSKGGELILHAYHGDAMGREERIVVLSEKVRDYNSHVFDPPYPYDFLYCGSPLFGRLNERRLREWIAYHDMVFGERSHFVLYDAGGIHEAARQALQPWIGLGRVSIQDVTSTAHFDGYYYNQFLMVNDCLQRSKFLANWTFFFDLDEYVYVEPPHSLHSVMAERHNHDGGFDGSVTEISFTQYRMVKNLCHSAGGGARAPHRMQSVFKQWGFEKLAYRDLSSSNRDVKYVCNPRAVYATGVHGVERFKRGPQERFNDTIVRYYHYHGIINMEDESAMCMELSDDMDGAHNFTRAKSTSEGGGIVQYDGSMLPFALVAKKHELEVLQKLLH